MSEYLEAYRAWAATVQLTFSQGAIIYTVGVLVGHTINRNWKMAVVSLVLVLMLLFSTTNPQQWGAPA